METFNIRDLRNRTGDLVRTAEKGHLSIITKHGRPVFVAVPFDENLLHTGVKTSLALGLYVEGKVGLSGAARIANLSSSEMVDVLNEQKIPLADYSKEELESELAQFES